MKKNQNSKIAKEIIIQQFPHYIPIIIFALTTIIFFWGQLSGSTFFWEDFAEYVFPTQSFAARESAGGTIPFWNPTIFGGMPFIADLQAGFFYPFNRILNFFVDSNGHLSVWALQFITILHFFIAQISFYFLIVHFKKNQLGAVFSAIGFAFSAIMVLHVIHPMIIYHLAWFPLVLMFFDKSINEQNLRYGAIAGLILGMSFLAGHPQTVLYLMTFLFIYFIWIIFTNYYKYKQPIRQIIWSKIPAIFTFLIAIGIFMIQYLPSKELADNAVRNESSYQKSAEGSMEFSQIYTYAIPNTYGVTIPDQNNTFPFYMMIDAQKQAPYYYYWETSFYFGISIFILGIFGFVVAFNDKRIQPLIFLVIVGFLYSLGDNFPLHKLFYNFPLFNLFRMPARMMMFSVIAFPISAAFGFDYLLKNKTNLKEIIYASAIPLLITLMGVFGIIASINETPQQLTSIITYKSLISLVFAIITVTIIYFLNKKTLTYYIAGFTLILIIFIDLYIAHSNFNASKQDIKTIYNIDNNLLSQFKINSLDNMYRVNTRSYNPPIMGTNRNQGMIDNFQNTEGYNPLVLARVMPAFSNNELNYDLLNVKYELKGNPSTGEAYFSENTNRLPRAWMVYDWKVLTTESIKNEMLQPTTDFTKQVILEEEPKIEKSVSSDSSNFFPNVTIKEYRNNYIRLEITNTEKAGILVLSEIWYPSWYATVDETPSRILKANYSLRGIEIPKGASKVELRFTSHNFAIGQWISIFAIIISIFLIFIGKYKSKVKNEPKSTTDA